MMSELKKLTSEDLNSISEFFGETLEKGIARKVSMKELEDIAMDFKVIYDDNQLDVVVDLGLCFDALSYIDQGLLNSAIDETYLKLDSFINENYRI